MKRTFLLRLTVEQSNLLCLGLSNHFMFRPNVTYNGYRAELTVEFATMGRNLYPDESCEAYPHKLGKPVSIDSIRWEQISCYVAEFMQNIA